MSDEPTNTRLYLDGVAQWQGIAGKLISAPFNYEDTGEPSKVELLDLFMMYAGVKEIGVANAAAFVRFGLLLTGEFITPPLSEYIDDLLLGIKLLSKKYSDAEQHHKHTKTIFTGGTETVLAFTYVKLREKELTYVEAAQFASELLNQDIKPNTWRMRVDRWAAKQGLPKVEQRKRSKK